MGGVTTVALASAVARAGGLGMLAGAGMDAASVIAELRRARDAAGGGVVGVNFLCPFLDLRVVEAVAAEAPYVEAFYGNPDRKVVELIAGGGAVAAWQVGSADEARAAEDVGCGLVIAQGYEAGGHVRGGVGLMPLLESVLAAVAVPVVAAGGIGSARAAAAAFAAGADGVRVGTRFLAAEEADVHPEYLAALAGAAADDTEITEAFSMGWPHAPHRVLRSCTAASDADPLLRSPLPPTRGFPGDVASAALYAGTSVANVTAVQPAAAIVAELLEMGR